MGLHGTATMSEGDTFRVTAYGDRTTIAWDTTTSINELVMAIGYRDWRYSPSLAMDQLDQLLGTVLEARNELARQTGRPVIDTRTLGPDGPDDPDDEPTDEPATAGTVDPTDRCGRCGHQAADHDDEPESSHSCVLASCDCYAWLRPTRGQVVAAAVLAAGGASADEAVRLSADVVAE